MPRVSIQVRVPFSDVDRTGRIHFTAMLRYMEVAEHELVRTLGFPRATSFADIEFPRVHVSCDYRRAVCYDDRLSVEARIAHVSHSSWRVAFTARLLQEVSKQEGEQALVEGEIAAEGEMTIVALDKLTERARALPDELRQALTSD
ncbi:acyl-CoA thioesterase [Ktedonosporobacter rubrisoli]|uniref:Acyl-CoA thioesterase n=1 Tax=Ktedonosporobacter rubrisoli TaxID=2509675 RepID=A0A4P6JNZ9_KTERU|nr:thioesterase family protein [Ktedonosporobacter rubrisoli]QBD77034.1 acyl-CoA thioesterase [Ktedonosporobacter rubrisoli]